MWAEREILAQREGRGRKILQEKIANFREKFGTDVISSDEEKQLLRPLDSMQVSYILSCVNGTRHLPKDPYEAILNLFQLDPKDKGGSDIRRRHSKKLLMGLLKENPELKRQLFDMTNGLEDRIKDQGLAPFFYETYLPKRFALSEALTQRAKEHEENRTR